MLEVNIRDARSNLSSLLDRVEAGEEIIIKRRGKTIAKIVSPHNNCKLPSLKEFRSSLKIQGKPMSQSIVDARKEDRF
ncbi:MAG: type II toxin-antitoxin system Phd/YefM family antitoxin [Deltaproteobacteria bacterium]|nr:type II toxin-antitoxin system Phd/YefM family antitoxin [Deltaproteobacteria bacterium]